MRVGVLGGTFDPVHYGHLMIAETCRDVLGLDRVLLIPAAISPLKTGQKPTDGHARADMAGLAVAGYPEFVVDRRELRRSGPSYTVDTLKELRQSLEGTELFFLMGADSLKDFLSWKNPEEIAELAQLVACNRPGYPALTTEQIEQWTGPALANRVRTIDVPGMDLSATEIRDRLRAGRSIRFLTPRSVEAFLREHKLYPGPSKSL